MPIKIDELDYPEEFRSTHFPHIIQGDWYLVPNEVQQSNDFTKQFQCLLFNSKGQLVPGHKEFSLEDLGFRNTSS